MQQQESVMTGTLMLSLCRLLQACEPLHVVDEHLYKQVVLQKNTSVKRNHCINYTSVTSAGVECALNYQWLGEQSSKLMFYNNYYTNKYYYI